MVEIGNVLAGTIIFVVAWLSFTYMVVKCTCGGEKDD